MKNFNEFYSISIDQFYSNFTSHILTVQFLFILKSFTFSLLQSNVKTEVKVLWQLFDRNHHQYY